MVSRGLCIGLMSGTSLDAIDAVLCEFDGHGRPQALLGSISNRYPNALRQELLTLQRRPDTPLTLRDLARLDVAIGDCFAQTANALLLQLDIPASAIAAIGSHGQTLFHDPHTLGTSLQLGDPNRIAAQTGICTIADFRRADMAHGGQGAPLVPAFHHAVFADARQPRIVLNIGGIANITILPNALSNVVTGFDTGPGNALLDDWIQSHKADAYDRDGLWAASGTLDTTLLSACLADSYFDLGAPKSTGRDYFNLDWLAARFAGLGRCVAADVQRSLLELTVESIARAIEAIAALDNPELFVCGGGARNAFMMQRLAARLPTIHIRDTSALGVDPAWVEASAFAWLAWQTLHAHPGNLPAVTGASRPAILGGIYAK